MADIDIEKKNKNNGKKIWLWVIGIIVIIGIIWWIASDDDEVEPEEVGLAGQVDTLLSLETEPPGADVRWIESFSTT